MLIQKVEFNCITECLNTSKKQLRKVGYVLVIL